MKNKKRVLLFFLLLIALLIFYMTKSNLKIESFNENKEILFVFLQENPLLTCFSYFFSYIFLTSLCLPVSGFFSLAGGVLFGFVKGTLLVSFASSIAALLTLLMSKFFFQAYVERKYANILRKINKKLETEGSFYLFSLRMFPIIPFSLVNLSFGLSNMPLTQFYLISQIGMLPVSMLYVHGGYQLKQISSVEDIFSIRIIMTLALFALLPLLIKILLKYISRKIKDKKLSS